MKVSSLKLRKKNPRKIEPAAMQKLKESIQRDPEFMVLRPIVVDAAMVALGGNQRLKAIVELGMTEIPDTWVVQAADLTQEQQERFILVDNAPDGMSGVWDMEMLAKEFQAPLLESLGFDMAELQAPGDGDNAGGSDPDEVPEAPGVPVTQRGDVWVCGRHRVACGDSTSAGDVERLMAGKTAALCHADPPYGMGKEKDGVQNDNLYRDKLDAFQMQWWRAFRQYIDDNGSAYIWGNAEDLWRLWYRGGLKDSERLTMRCEIVWLKTYSSKGTPDAMGQKSEIARLFMPATERCLFFMLGEQGFNNNADNYWEGWDSVVNYLRAEKEKTGWDIAKFKRLAGHSETSGCHWFDKSQWSFPTKAVYESWQKAAQCDAFKRDYDAFKRDYDAFKRDYDDLKQEFYATRAYFNNTHDNMTDVWEFPRVTGAERHGHATPKPVAMIERIMLSSLPENGLCVEPFLGSGSTLIAAEKTNRTCYGMEISPAYCDIICQRYYNFTGELPVLEATGEPFSLPDEESGGGG